MKTSWASLVLGASALHIHIDSTNGLVQATPLHAGIDRYLLDKDQLGDEVNAWMTKWNTTAGKNGWIPKPKSANATAKDIDDDRRQRFYLAKQLVQRLKTQNPQAEFSTDSPFTLLTTDEFALYVRNSFVASGSQNTRTKGDDTLGHATDASTDEGNASGDATVDHNGVTNVCTCQTPVNHTGTNDQATNGGTDDQSSRRHNGSTDDGGTNHSGAHDGGAHDSDADDQATDARADCHDCGATAIEGRLVNDQVHVPDSEPRPVRVVLGVCERRSRRNGQCLAQGTLTKLSEQTLTSCDTRNYGCNGGVPLYAMQFIQQNGLCTLATDPYTAGSGVLASCNTACAKVKTGMTGVQTLAQTEPSLIAALSQRPVVIAVQAGNDAWKQYKSGVLSACPSATASIDHAVVAVGFDATSIKIRNSWGTAWGESGYIRLARSTTGMGTCNMFQQMAVATF